jgi:hypothetical protein
MKPRNPRAAIIFKDYSSAAGEAGKSSGTPVREAETAMQQDLDRLMTDRNLDALWITGPANHNPAMVYFTGVANVTRADLIKKRNEPPVLFPIPWSAKRRPGPVSAAETIMN